MYTKLNIKKSKILKIKTNYFKISINFYLGSGRYKEIVIETKKENEVIDIVNELKKLDKWFIQSSIEDIIKNSLFKEYLIEDIFEVEVENLEIRFEDKERDLNIKWIDELGNECSVELS
jgi:hypothetical protein